MNDILENLFSVHIGPDEDKIISLFDNPHNTGLTASLNQRLRFVKGDFIVR
jgi:hypothetical protein